MVYDDCVFLVVDLYRVCGNFAGEAQESHAHSTLSHTLLTDHCNASESPEHNIISVSPYYDKHIILDAYAYGSYPSACKSSTLYDSFAPLVWSIISTVVLFWLWTHQNHNNTHLIVLGLVNPATLPTLLLHFNKGSFPFRRFRCYLNCTKLIDLDECDWCQFWRFFID